jgi:nickel-dependent lactate racemase
VNVTTLELPFGRARVSVQIPASNLLGVFSPQESTKAFDETAFVHTALTHPIGTPHLRDLARPGQKVAIVTSDRTRPCPSEQLLPPVLGELSVAGVPEGDILIIVALGLHRPMNASELEAAVGADVYRRVRVVNHDPADTIRLGATSAGTLVELFRPLVEADLRICLGNLEFHYFAGYSGGAKAILPGCASETTVRANHAMMVRPEAVAGRLEGNPVRADIEEGTGLLGVDFILNVLVDGNHHIVDAVAGEVTAAHRRGCEMVAQRGTVSVPGLADIVLVSAGGYPKDANLYQAQKALDNAGHAVREGGIIVLVAECSEGYGNRTFETWMSEARSPDAVLNRIQQAFVLGGHKAAAVASVLKRAHVYLVSALPTESVRGCGLVPFDDLGEAMATALRKAGSKASVIVLPHGGSILPVVDQVVDEADRTATV